MNLKILFPIIFSFLILACSSVDVTRDYKQNFDFTVFETYKIVKETPRGPNGEEMPSATFNIIKSAIDYQMAKKGFGKNDKLANFGITWHTALNDEVYENVDGLNDWQNAFDKKEEGMLIIDIVYLEEDKVVWRGWTKNVLSSENLDEKIKESVEEILEPFPPTSVPLGN